MSSAMGRLQPTPVMPPTVTRRADRAKRAKDTLTRVLPDLLRSSPRARHGVHKALLMTDPQSVTTSPQQSNTKVRIRVQCTDTLTAARRLTQYSRRASIAAQATRSTGTGRATGLANVCVLNMASPIRPGGGFLDGTTSPEEFLCMRTTLYPSLWDDFYRLPDVGGVVTPDVLVFRDSTPEADDLPGRERFFVDVVSAAMIRFPGTNSSRHREGEGEDERETPCSCGVSYCDRDRELVTRKMRAVLRMAQSRGAEKVVLGAWGCGAAYGNPVQEVAKIWKRVLCGTKQLQTEAWTGVKEVVFAIPDRAMLKEFERCFADVMSPAEDGASPPLQDESREAMAVAAVSSARLLAELVARIQETELQLDQISNPRSKARLRDELASLNRQLTTAGEAIWPDDEPALADEEEEETTMTATTATEQDGQQHHHTDGIAGSDGEDNSYYNFDSSDLASSSSGASSPTTSSLYDFRFSLPRDIAMMPPIAAGAPAPRLSRTASQRFGGDGHRDDDCDMAQSPDTTYSSLATTDGGAPPDRGRSDSLDDVDNDDDASLPNNGWFSGSINGLSALLMASKGGWHGEVRPSSPELVRPQSLGQQHGSFGRATGGSLDGNRDADGIEDEAGYPIRYSRHAVRT